MGSAVAQGIGQDAENFGLFGNLKMGLTIPDNFLKSQEKSLAKFKSTRQSKNKQGFRKIHKRKQSSRDLRSEWVRKAPLVGACLTGSTVGISKTSSARSLTQHARTQGCRH
jgi:hypothetical protein